MPESNRGIQLERLIFLIREIAAHHNGITAQKLADTIGVSNRTIQRNLNALMLDLPLTFEKRGRHIYYFFPYKLDLPADLLSIDEILALLALVKNSPHWEGTVLERSVNSALSKLRQLISPSEVGFSRNKIEPFLIQKRGFVEYKQDWLKGFSEAVDNSLRLDIVYRSIGDNRTKKWKADPLLIVEHDQAFYAVVGVPRYKTARIIALSRILKAENTDKTFDPSEYDFKAESLMVDCFGIWIGDPQKVKVEFTDWAATFVSERLWHPTQKVTANDNNSVIIEFESGSIPEISRWVLSFGSMAKALMPKSLKTMVKLELKKAMQTYDI